MNAANVFHGKIIPDLIRVKSKGIPTVTILKWRLQDSGDALSGFYTVGAGIIIKLLVILNYEIFSIANFLDILEFWMVNLEY